VCDWSVYCGAAKNGNWNEYPDIEPDVCGLKIYNNETTGDLWVDDQSIREGHFKHWTSAKPIAVHAEDETVLEVLALVRQYRRKTHFCHISTAHEIDNLRAAKEEGLPVSIGVTPHHLHLTENDVKTLGTLGMMKPPLKTPVDRDALWSALAGGLVDVIESDHAPHTPEEKRSDKIYYGVPGLQTTLPLMLTAAVEGRIALDRVIEMLSSNPHRIFGLICPPDTYTMVDIDDSFVIDRSWLRGNCRWSLFEGMRVRGCVREVWIRGTKVFDGENVLVQPGFGQNLYG
jgi:carbamoyl-phosphate synthase/aspartate carbamoyltransferase/dihydroorotase